MASRTPDTYDAFISYSHAIDGALAPALQRGLQRFAKPWYRTRALRVFRDEASLSANPGLWSSIEQALDASSWFILLASPGSAASPWVAREIAHWSVTKPVGRLFIALTDGELVWDPERRDFDWERTNAVPEALRGAFDDEPRFIDLRWAHATEQLSLSNGRFRDAVADLAAPLHGVPKDILAGEEVRQHRRTVRIARGAALALASLTLASVLFAVFALRQRSEAIAQRDLAVSRSLVQAAAARLDSEIDLAALLSIEAFRINTSAETRSGLITAVERSKHVDSLRHAGQPIESIAFSPDRGMLVAAGTRNVSIWDVEDAARAPLVVPVARAKAVVVERHGRSIAVGGPQAISIWNIESRPRRVDSLPLEGATALADVGRGQLGAIGPSTGVLFSRSGRVLRRWAFPLGVASAAFALDRPVAAVGGPHGLALVDMRRGSRIEVATSEIPSGIAISADGTMVAALDRAGDDVTIWTPRSRAIRQQHLQQPATQLAFTPDGSRLVVGRPNGTVDLLPIAGAIPPATLRGPAGAIYDAVFPSDAPLATAGEQGIIVLWTPDTTPVGRVLGRIGPTFGIDYSDGAHTLAVAGFGNALRLWDLGETPDARHAVFAGGDQRAVSADSTGTSFVVAKSDGSVVYLEAGRRSRQLHPPGGDTTHRPVAISSRGLVAWGTGNTVGLWESASERTRSPLDVEPAPTDLAFSANGTSVVVAGTRGVSVWDVDTRRGTQLDDAPSSSVAIGSSGTLVAFATVGQVVLWSSELSRRRVAVPIDLSESVSLAFTPDEETLAIGTSSGMLRLVDVLTGAFLGPAHVLEGGSIVGVDFSPDGTALATATQGGVVAVWDDLLWSDTDAMRLHLCSVVGRNLTEEEWQEFLPGRTYRATCR